MITSHDSTFLLFSQITVFETPCKQPTFLWFEKLVGFRNWGFEKLGFHWSSLHFRWSLTGGLTVLPVCEHTNASFYIHNSEALIWNDHSKPFLVRDKNWSVEAIFLKSVHRQVFAIVKFQDDIVLSKNQKTKCTIH